MQQKRLRIAIFRGESLFGSERRWFYGDDADAAEYFAVQWAKAWNASNPSDRPFIRYTVMDTGDGVEMPKTVRAGEVA